MGGSKMIVTICGAYKNAGDHLIGDRARALLRAHVDPDIVVLDRKAIKTDDSELFRKARAVLLTGGPAYQREIYPTIYPIELENIPCPVIPFGLGWKAPSTQAPIEFRFSPSGEKFIRAVHNRIPCSSARDPLTVEVLGSLGVDNVIMTGCPAWYDLSYLDEPYAFTDRVQKLVLSTPARIQPGTRKLMLWLGKRFPNANRVLSFHHGLLPALNKSGIKRAADFARLSFEAMRYGWQVESLAGSLEKLETVYSSADLHIGYRVHAHLFCLSRRIPSILINEDSRGAGQACALGTKSLGVGDGKIDAIKAAIEHHFETRGSDVSASVERMLSTYPEMKRFLATI